MTDETTPQDSAAMSPASAGSHGDQCRCGLATRLVGDGCERCNPAMMIDILREQVAEMRFTAEEREAVEFFSAMEWPKASKQIRARSATLRGLLERLT